MSIQVKNPREYVTTIPTNIRLKPHVKYFARAEASRMDKTISSYINYIIELEIEKQKGE